MALIIVPILIYITYIQNAALLYWVYRVPSTLDTSHIHRRISLFVGEYSVHI
jgi:hypothetical protein